MSCERALESRALAAALAVARSWGRRWPSLREEFASSAGLAALDALRTATGDPIRYARYKARRRFGTIVERRRRGMGRMLRLEFDPPDRRGPSVDSDDAFGWMLGLVSRKQAELLASVYVEGRDVAEAGRRLGIARQSAHQRHRLAMATIRGSLAP